MRNFIQYIDSSYRLKVQECSFEDGHYRVSNIPDNFFVVSLFVNSKKVSGVYLRNNESLFCEGILNDLGNIDLNMIPENVFFAPLQVVDLMYSANNDVLNCVCNCTCDCGSSGGGVDAPTIALNSMSVDYTILGLVARGNLANSLEVQTSFHSDFSDINQSFFIDKSTQQFNYVGRLQSDAYVRIHDSLNNMYSNILPVPAFVPASITLQNLNNDFISFDFQYLGSNRSPLLQIQIFDGQNWNPISDTDSTTGHFEIAINPSVTYQKVRLFDYMNNNIYSNEIVAYVPVQVPVLTKFYFESNWEAGDTIHHPEVNSWVDYIDLAGQQQRFFAGSLQDGCQLLEAVSIVHVNGCHECIPEPKFTVSYETLGYNDIMLTFHLNDYLRSLLPAQLNGIGVTADYFVSIGQHRIVSYPLGSANAGGNRQGGILTVGTNQLNCSFTFNGVTYYSNTLDITL